MKPVAILGSGPAGMMAAHAVGMAGVPMAMFSKTLEPSHIGGAQFLHRSLPALTEHDNPDAIITFRLFGDRDGYERKVYGDPAEDRLSRPPFVSFQNLTDQQQQPAWNLRSVYDKLWALLGDAINEADIDAQWIADHGTDFEFIINTIPRPALCRRRIGMDEGVHRFTHQVIKVAQPCGIAENYHDNIVVYDGTDNTSWYRSSKIFGVTSAEWSDRLSPPFTTVNVSKPLATNCDCWRDAGPAPILHTGRFGLWQKGILTHDAFVDSVKYMQTRGIL